MLETASGVRSQSLLHCRDTETERERERDWREPGSTQNPTHNHSAPALPKPVQEKFHAYKPESPALHMQEEEGRRAPGLAQTSLSPLGRVKQPDTHLLPEQALDRWRKEPGCCTISQCLHPWEVHSSPGRVPCLTPPQCRKYRLKRGSTAYKLSN